MNRVRWKAALTLLLVFVVGAVCSAVVTRIVTQRTIMNLLDGPPERIRTHAILFRLNLELDLTQEQRAELQSILEKHQPELAVLRQSIEPQVKAVRTKQWAEMRALLREDQRAAFDRMVHDLETRLSRTLSSARAASAVSGTLTTPK
ncbi:MAG TPA: hypothetical protein VIV60_30950 [Polyangiaceae bacterium]